LRLNSRPLVSVVIPVLDEEKAISRCLASITGQTFGGSIEILIVDNGSTDSTVEIASKYRNVRITSCHGPLGAARQHGIENARGEYLAFIDADEFADPRWLSTLYDARRNGDALIGRILAVSNSEDKISEYYRTRLDMDALFAHDAIASRRIVTFPTGNLWIARVKALQIGFDNSLPFAEDGDFGYRFLRTGYSAKYEASATVFHSTPTTLRGMLRSYRKLALGSKLLMRKHRSNRLIALFIASAFYQLTAANLSRVKAMARNQLPLHLAIAFVVAITYIWTIVRPLTRNQIQGLTVRGLSRGERASR
jgi:glycosyltransferase involved in cell wall biosynthesis